MSEKTVSKVKILLETNNNQIIKCELKRHLSPKTVGQIMRALPLGGHAHLLGNSAVYFETPIDSGIERKKNEFKKGDIAFLPIGGLICFFYSDVNVGKAMTSIGKITANIDILATVKSGTDLKFYYDVGE